MLNRLNMWWLVFAVVCVGVCQGQERLDPLVQTSLGLVRGQRAEDGDYYMFLGIPYGKVDENNPFGVASPHPIYEDIFDANDDSAICPQVSAGAAVGTLDCLRVNVFVPTTATSQNKLPVLVYIYGGSYQTGYGSRHQYGPKYLIPHDVIVVHINYRLGPYGFLCLGIPEVPGNQGIKDQLIALRWIKENIDSFGGDSAKITIMGESAGAGSVELHLLSKQEKLYSKAILHSGTTLKPKGVYDTDETPALQMADKLGYPTQDVYEAVDFLSQVDINLVIGAYSALGFTLRACVEKPMDGIESIITEYPVNLNVPKVKGMPILVGYNNREALRTDKSNPSDYFKSPTYFRDILALCFNVDDDFEEFVDMVRSFYIGDEELTEEVRPNIIDFETDYHFNFPVERAIEKYLQSEPENLFQYLFSYEGGRNVMKNLLNITQKGVAHADELGYLFEMSAHESTPTEADQLMIDRMTTLWTNFVKYGDPTPQTTELLPIKWLPGTNATANYLDMDSVLTMKKKPFKERLTFLKLFFKTNHNRLIGLNTNYN
ncbi:juvenile hormone esterase-like [Bicyclus anynana]|uniref:Carboxylic ester hydrolase n=1 Tax=Bicyclus anynana TaxID=110368 RepID=A0ABM3M553_BICAN|nr:juvenile hormone esterase-like [Bicyclus anynana]